MTFIRVLRHFRMNFCGVFAHTFVSASLSLILLISFLHELCDRRGNSISFDHKNLPVFRTRSVASIRISYGIKSNAHARSHARPRTFLHFQRRIRCIETGENWHLVVDIPVFHTHTQFAPIDCATNRNQSILNRNRTEINHKHISQRQNANNNNLFSYRF